MQRLGEQGLSHSCVYGCSSQLILHDYYGVPGEVLPCQHHLGGDLLEKQILGLSLRLTEFEIVGLGPVICILTIFAGDFHAC